MKTFLKALGIVGLTFSIGAGGVWAQSGFSSNGLAAMLAMLTNIHNDLGTAAPDCGALSSCPNLGYSAPLSAPKGGASPYHLLVSTASTNSNNVKGSAGTVYSITVVQTTTTLGDLRIYDSSTAPTCSSSTNMVHNIPIQSNATSPGVHLTFPTGLKFSNGIGFCFTGAVADNDSTNWGGTASGVAINIGYN